MVQLSSTNITSGTIRNQVVCTAVDTADSSVPAEVDVGTVVKAIYVEMWITSNDATTSTVTVNLEKVPRLTDLQIFAESQLIHDYFNKNNIFYITQGIVPPTNQSGIPFLRGWFKIPKGKQRMDKESAIILNISAISNGLTVCGAFVYKSYQ